MIVLGSLFSMTGNGKNKSSMKTTELKEIMSPNKADIQGHGIVEFYTPEQVVEILCLLGVSNRREQLISFFNWYQDDPKELSNNETIVDAYLDEINCT